nr:MAG TPA: hypothetical protein [Caudoviricetes sp.]
MQQKKEPPLLRRLHGRNGVRWLCYASDSSSAVVSAGASAVSPFA